MRKRMVWLAVSALAAALTATAAMAATLGGTGAPIAQNLEFETCKNVAYYGRLTATDPQGDAVTFQLVEKPARGQVELAGDSSGAFVYTPYEDKTGKDSFKFVAVDSQGNTSKTAKVSLRIRKPKTKVNYADMDGQESRNAAIALAEADVMVGEKIGDSYYFHPQETVTRQEFVTMAMAALGEEPIAQTMRTGFADDEAIPTWGKGYVASALQSGYIRGTTDEEGQVIFAPEQAVSRGEAAVILNRMLAVTDVAVTTFYPDTEAAPAWAFQAAVNLTTAGVMETDSGALALEETLDRGECAKLLVGAMAVAESREGSWLSGT